MGSSEGSIFVGKVSRHSLHPSATKNVAQDVPRSSLFFFVAVVLQGCGGCDEDAYAKCTTPAYADGVCSTFSKCIKDADCCDHEANGAKVKDAVAALCTASKAAV